MVTRQLGNLVMNIKFLSINSYLGNIQELRALIKAPEVHIQIPGATQSIQVPEMFIIIPIIVPIMVPIIVFIVGFIMGLICGAYYDSRGPPGGTRGRGCPQE